MNAKENGDIMIRLYDVAQDGTAVIFDEQVSLLSSGKTSFELRSTDWILAAGHSLAVEIGTIARETISLDPKFGPGNGWIGTPTQKTMKITRAQLDLALADPADDTATEGARSPYLDTYLANKTTNLPVGPATFTVSRAHR